MARTSERLRRIAQSLEMGGEEKGEKEKKKARGRGRGGGYI